MTEARLMKLLKVHAKERLSEDNDQDVNWLVDRGYLDWDDDAQTHRVTAPGRAVIRRAVAGAGPSEGA